VQTRELALIRCTYSFFIGVLTWVVVQTRRPGKLSGTPGAVCVALGVGLTCIPEYFPKLFLPLVFSAVVGTLVLGREDSLIRKLLSRPHVVYLGTISYGIYMVHAWIWEAINIVLVKGLGYPLAADGATVDLTLRGQVLWVAVGMALTIVGAHVSYHAIEQPWRQH